MALTDEQYEQIFRYVDKGMEADELKAFEAALIENKELHDELEFYKQVRLLGDSVEEKIRGNGPLQGEEKKSNHEETWAMLANARKSWENRYEAELKLKYGLTAATNIPKNRPKIWIRRMNISRWQIAALLIGFISMGIFWWNYQDEKRNSSTSINKKTGDSAVATNNNAPDSVQNNNQIQLTPPPENAPSENTVERNEEQKPSILFASNFKPDALPPDKEGPLETAFVNYEQGQYVQAGRDFENADIGPVTRGDAEENRKLWEFYIHYYQALSYMAANVKTSTAISKLKNAVTTSPDAAWKTKAQWYLALAHLRNNEVKAAEALIKEIASSNQSTALKQQATALGKALNEE